MNRRALLKAAPALALVGAVPAQGMVPDTMPSTDTPVMALFREWKAHNDWLNSSATNGMPSEDFDRLCDDDTAIIEKMMLTPAQTAQDVLVKLLAVTDFGSSIVYVDLEGADRLPGEALAMIGA